MIQMLLTMLVVGLAEIEIETAPGRVVIPPRPPWVEAAAVREGDIHTTAVSSGPHETRQECARALDERLQSAVDQYVEEYLAGDQRGRWTASRMVRYELPFIKERLVRPEEVYDEVIQVSFGPMHQRHALVRFDAAFREDLDRHWREAVVTGRLLGAALAFAGVLALLAVVCGYFKLDRATRGCYRGRLQWIAAAAILGLAAAGVLLGRRLPWI